MWDVPFFISPRAPITTGIVVVFIPHIRSTSRSRSLYFDSFSVTLLLLLLLIHTVKHFANYPSFKEEV